MGSSINDGLVPTNHDANATSLEDSFNYLASQVADITGKSTWEAAPDLSIATMAAKTWLDDKKAIRDRLILTDITVPTAAKSAGTLTTVTGAEIIDGEYFTLNDGVNPAVKFEFDSDSSVVESSTLRAVVFTSGDSANTIRDTIITAVYNAPTLAITASSGGASTVNLLNDTNGSFGNIPIISTVADVDWVVVGMLSGAGNSVTLVQASSETPSRKIAIATTVSGAVCAKLSTLIGCAALTKISGDVALTPQNLVYVVDADTGDIIPSGLRTVYGLLQVESTATDNTDFDDSSNQAQITFVRANSTYTDLELVPAADIAGKKIIYSYGDREALNLWSQSDWRRQAVVVDISAAAIANSLDLAYNGGSQVAVDDTEVDWRLTDTKHFYISDSGGSARILDVLAASGGDSITINAPGGVGITGDLTISTDQATINGVVVGGSAGTVATTSGDLCLVGADDIMLTTVRQSALPLDDVTAGPISALAGGPHASVAAAIKYAIEHGKVKVGVFVAGRAYSRDENIPAGTGGISLDTPHSGDMNTPAGVDTFLFWNGVLKFGGNGTTQNDWYAGTTPASGDVKVDHPGGARNGDVLITLQIATT
jgi:hypothetical protein